MGQTQAYLWDASTANRSPHRYRLTNLHCLAIAIAEEAISAHSKVMGLETKDSKSVGEKFAHANGPADNTTCALHCQMLYLHDDSGILEGGPATVMDAGQSWVT